MYYTIFFDGYCVLCNGVVDFLIKADINKKFRYTTLQGKTARQNLPGNNLIPSDDGTYKSIILLSPFGQIYTKSSAAIEIIARLHPLFGWTRIFKIIPLFLRDGLYDLIATYRYDLVGKTDSCRVPTPDEKELILP